MSNSRGYYLNGLKALRSSLLKERRMLQKRHETMLNIGHPDANDQGIMIDINRQMLEVVESAQRVAHALPGCKWRG